MDEDTLIIVYQDEIFAKQIEKMLNEHMIVIDARKENILLDIEFWSVKTWIEKKRASNISNKILFLGEIKEVQDLIQFVDITFEKFGVKYGFAGNRAVIWCDSSVLMKKEAYDAFFREFDLLPILDALKTPANIKIPTKKLATTVALDLFLTLGASSSVLLAKNSYENKKMINRQMLIYGLVNFFNSHLESFMQAKDAEDIGAEIDENYRKLRREKRKKLVVTARKIAGGIAIAAGVIGVAILATQSAEGENIDNVSATTNGIDDEMCEGEKVRYKIIFDGEEEDEEFDTEEDAEEYALYLRSCSRLGAEILHMSNPGDYDYNEDEYEEPEYKIIEVDD